MGSQENHELSTQKTSEPSITASTTIEAAPLSSEPQSIERKGTMNVKLSEPERQHSQQNRRRSTRQPTLDSGSSVLQRMNSHLEPSKELAPPPELWKSLYSILTASWLNVLLLCIPISWAFHFAKLSDTLIFVFAFLAIIPLAKLLAFATDELSIRVGQTLAGLLNATLGNAVELIVAIIALVKCELRIVQSSLVGSILSNLLLVLGMCFFAGGMRFSEQGFGLSSTQINSSLLTISVIAVLIPAAFHFAADSSISDSVENTDILRVSHGVAIVLLFIYGSYLVFQLFSHKSLYDDDDSNTDRQKTKEYTGEDRLKLNIRKRLHMKRRNSRDPNANTNADGDTTLATTTDPEAGASIKEDDVEQPNMSLTVAIVLLATVTVLVAVTAEFLVDSISGLTSSGRISQEFVGIILLPIVGNAAEHVTAVTVSVKDKLTLSIGVAVGSSIQIALFVIPFIVTLGWILGKPLDLLFDPLESIILFLAVLTVNYVTQDGKSNWLEGMILMCLYVICAVTFWFYPGSTYPITCT